MNYNRSDNATRAFTVARHRSSHGRSSIDIRCPFCGTVSTAFLWSLYGGGKRCVNKHCGAKHCKGGYSIPVEGREEMQP